MDNKFIELCCGNKLDKLKKMYQNYNIDIHHYNDLAFRVSCYFGHLNVAQWLYSLGGINIHTGSEYAFTTSCGNGHLNVAQWLYSLGGVNIHAENEYAFKFSCYRNHIEILKWLLLICKIDSTTVDENLPEQYYDYAFSLGYLPINKMIPAYVEYKNKIKNEIKEKNENGIISVFELSYIVDIIMIYI